MIETTETIDDIKKSKRWLVVLDRTFDVNDKDKMITLDRFDLAYSLGRLLAWADKAPRKHGKFYLSDLTRKQKGLCENYLDDRFVLVG